MGKSRRTQQTMPRHDPFNWLRILIRRIDDEIVSQTSTELGYDMTERELVPFARRVYLDTSASCLLRPCRLPNSRSSSTSTIHPVHHPALSSYAAWIASVAWQAREPRPFDPQVEAARGKRCSIKTSSCRSCFAPWIVSVDSTRQ